MADLELCNAKIVSATISNDDHGLLTAYIHLDYGGMSQGFGGYSLYLPKFFKQHKKQANYAGHFIWRVMEIAEVSEWGQLVGKTIRVKKEWTKIHEIGHIIKDDWFNPSTDFQQMSKEVAEQDINAEV